MAADSTDSVKSTMAEGRCPTCGKVAHFSVNIRHEDDVPGEPGAIHHVSFTVLDLHDEMNVEPAPSITDDDARRWYHSALPGGMGRDWLTHYPSAPEAALAAFLWACGVLHVDDEGKPTVSQHHPTKRPCIFCLAKPRWEPADG
jgi:hypothetical protein